MCVFLSPETLWATGMRGPTQVTKGSQGVQEVVSAVPLLGPGAFSGRERGRASRSLDTASPGPTAGLTESTADPPLSLDVDLL